MAHDNSHSRGPGRDGHGNLWKKGAPSPNPGGYTKAHAAQRRMAQELVADRTDGGKKIINFVADVLDNKNGPENGGTWDTKSRRWAADFLSDRLWGKSPVTVEIAKDVPRPLNMDALNDAQLEALSTLDAASPAEHSEASVEPAEPDPDDGDGGEPGAN